MKAPQRMARIELMAPLSGVMVQLDTVPDPVFAQKMVGDGVSIDPTSDELLAPFAGTVTQLHRAAHAVTVTGESGLQVLIHIGLDTVMLRGEGFTPLVKEGDAVTTGQPLIRFDPVVVGARAVSLPPPTRTSSPAYRHRRGSRSARSCSSVRKSSTWPKPAKRRNASAHGSRPRITKRVSKSRR
jgi:glucose-specific phosphotransferase system IIA component